MALIHICDICKSSDSVKTHRFTIGRQPDLSGNGYNDNQEIFDLCDQCAISILSYGIKQIYKNNFDKRIEINNEMVTFIKQRIKD